MTKKKTQKTTRRRAPRPKGGPVAEPHYEASPEQKQEARALVPYMFIALAFAIGAAFYVGQTLSFGPGLVVCFIICVASARFFNGLRAKVMRFDPAPFWVSASALAISALLWAFMLLPVFLLGRFMA